MMEIEPPTKPRTLVKETSKTRNIINKLRDNPQRMQALKESLKYFSLLKRNHYLERRRHKPTLDDVLICNCVPSGDDARYQSVNCGDRCLNRYTCTECDVELCPCGEQCKNRRFQRHEDACIYPFRCGGKGWGLSAGERIAKGQFIMQYIGEIFYMHSPLGRRRTQEYSKSTCTYLMKINNQEVIDPTYKGNLARFINHSCEPNCITVKWNVLGEVCIGIFANRDISEDEELTFDYQFDAYNTPLTKCLCGTASCKGYLGLKPTNITQEKWEEHLETMLCKICEIKTSQDDDKLLLCDKCNCGFHMFCLKPPLEHVPKDSWFCTQCMEELQDEKEQERLRLESLAQKKIKTIVKKRPRKRMSDTSSSSSNEEYEERYKQLKHLEEIATQELLQVKAPEDVSIEPDRIRKKPSTINEEEKMQELKDMQKKMQPASTQDPKKLQLQNIVDIAHGKFTRAFEAATELQQRIAGLASTASSNEIIKDCIRVNIIEQKVVRKNAALVYRIGNKTSFEQVDSDHVDFFRKENDLTVLGSAAQIAVFREMFAMVESIIRELKKELGIVEGQVKIPVLFLKRVVLALGELEQQHQVNILYNKQAAHMEEIFPLDRMTPIKIKGSKVNIQACVNEINNYIHQLTVYRLYISRSETKTVQQNMFHLRQPNQAEIRISRDSVYRGEHLQRDINHPFFYIQFREKEVCLIGTERQVYDTSAAINGLLEQERTKESDKEVTYFTVLVSTCYKENCKQVKSLMEKQSSSTKVLLFEASHPRKNLTILVLCLRTQLQQVREKFSEMIKQSNEKIMLESFQDQMSMQMCRYVFKYLQNTLMTDEMAFMKNWDLITPYFFNFNAFRKDNQDENWFAKRCINYQLLRDFETQLYVQYILGQKIASYLSDSERALRKKNVIVLMRKILNGLAFYKKNNAEGDPPMPRPPERVIFSQDAHKYPSPQQAYQQDSSRVDSPEAEQLPQPQSPPSIAKPESSSKSNSFSLESSDSSSSGSSASSSSSHHRHRSRYHQRKNKRYRRTGSPYSDYSRKKAKSRPPIQKREGQYVYRDTRYDQANKQRQKGDSPRQQNRYNGKVSRHSPAGIFVKEYGKPKPKPQLGYIRRAESSSSRSRSHHKRVSKHR